MLGVFMSIPISEPISNSSLLGVFIDVVVVVVVARVADLVVAFVVDLVVVFGVLLLLLLCVSVELRRALLRGVMDDDDWLLEFMID